MPTEKIQLDKPLTAQQKIDYNGFRLAGVSPQRALDRILGNELEDPGLEQNKVLARGTDNFLKDLGGDLVETGKGVFDTITTAGDKIRDIAKEEDRGIFSKALGIGGEAFRGIGRTIGEVFIGGAKAVVPQSVEDKVGETVEKGGQKAGEAVANYATENPDSQVVQTVKGLIDKYENDKNFRDAVDAGGGFAEGLAEIFGGSVATKGLKKGLEATKTGVEGTTNLGSRFGALLPTPKPVKTLAGEAKKPKTFDDFIKTVDEAGNEKYREPGIGVQTETGKPITIKAYHGTNKDFDKFIISDEGTRYTGDGVYFTPSKVGAEGYAQGDGGRVVESYLTLENPYNLYLPEGNIDYQPGSEAINNILGKGHDSIIVRIRDTDTRTGVVEADFINEIVVFDVDKIKSKDDLRKMFEQETPDTVTPDPGIVGKAKEKAGQAVDRTLESAVGLGHKAMMKYQQVSEGATQRITQNLDRKALKANAVLPPKQVDKNIGDMYVNAVSPGVKGKKKTLEGITQNKQKAVEVVKDIAENRKDLSFKDVETDTLIKGELPTNLWELGSAVGDRKSTIYKKVLDSIGKAKDEPVNTKRISDAMLEIVNDPVYANETAIINRAEQIFDKFSGNKYKPDQIEDLIKLENDRLGAFYRGNGTQADAVVSAIVANNLRDLLDETVEKAGGEAVGALKRQYGAYKAVEYDIVHRAIHNSQARKSGLVNMFGIKTVGDLTRGLAGDVGALKQGAGQIVGESFISALNDRDALINRMFLVADQTYNK